MVQVSSRTQSTVLDTAASSAQPLVAQYSLRSEVAKLRPRLVTTRGPDTRLAAGRSEGSVARMASAEDVRIEAATVVISPGAQPGHSTPV